MDMASDFGSEDCGFESRRGQMFLSLESYRVGGNKLLLANCFLADRTPLKATSRERNVRETESNLSIVLYWDALYDDFKEEFLFLKNHEFIF